MSYFDIYGETQRPLSDAGDFLPPSAPEPTPGSIQMPEPPQQPVEITEQSTSLFSWIPSFNTSMIVLIIFAIIGALYAIYIFRDVIYASLEEILIYFGIIEAPALTPEEPVMKQEKKQHKEGEKGKYCVVGRNENGLVCVPYTNQRDCNSKEYVNESDCVNL
jgi:hypothetical protein